MKQNIKKVLNWIKKKAQADQKAWIQIRIKRQEVREAEAQEQQTERIKTAKFRVRVREELKRNRAKHGFMGGVGYSLSKASTPLMGQFKQITKERQTSLPW